jgi:hypothetical protein
VASPHFSETASIDEFTRRQSQKIIIIIILTAVKISVKNILD